MILPKVETKRLNDASSVRAATIGARQGAEFQSFSPG